MDKKGRVFLVVSISLVILLVIVMFLYFVLFKPNISRSYALQGINLTSPIENLSEQQAIDNFNESYVSYLLYSIGAYGLHSSSFNGADPKIGVDVNGEHYEAIVQNAVIKVSKRESVKPDVVIITSKGEIIKMIKDKNYVKESFSSGESSIEPKASKTTLFAKGYLNLYNDLNSEGITGNIIKISTN